MGKYDRGRDETRKDRVKVVTTVDSRSSSLGGSSRRPWALDRNVSLLSYEEAKVLVVQISA